MTGQRRKNYVWLLVTFAVIGVDQATKWLVQHEMGLDQVIPLIPHLNLVCRHNTGAAFSMFNHAPAAVFVAFAAIVSVAILVWLYRNPRGQSVMAAGLCLIMGGAIGNALDRLTRGFVVDFVDFYIGNWHFAAFNVADSSITVGAGLLLLDMLLSLVRGNTRQRD